MIKLPRRRFLQLAAGTAALPALSTFATAQIYPARAARIIVGYPPGGTSDILARLMAQWLSERLGQPFIVENRPGASGNIATEVVVRAPPDGYTLLMVDPSPIINATLHGKLNFIRDIVPVATIIRQPLVMVVHPSVPAKTVPEFTAYAKANPGKINMTSPGNGTPPHMAGELFKMMAGVNIVHVPYRGAAPAMIDLIAGQVQLYFCTIAASIEYIRADKLRALAVTAAARSDVLPDIPTVGDFVSGYEVSAWFGMGVPKMTPTEIVDRLNREINAGLADPRIKAQLADYGGGEFALSLAGFGKLIAEETDKWTKVVRFAGIKPE
jgi:tripartite-type tricarboxylate transporter receptor subunit TctC